MLLPAFVTVQSPTPSPAPHTSAAPRAAQLFSLRERRRIAAYLRMRLLELREAGLERAAAAIERRLQPRSDCAPEGERPRT
jgi:hypothetical protein